MTQQRYKIITCGYEHDLCTEVSEAINQGWEPLGGVVIETTYPEIRVHDVSESYSFTGDLKYKIGSNWDTKYKQTVWLPPQKKTSWWRK